MSYYQNEDGGFGHAVEADCWNPKSIPLHDNTASDIIREIGFDDARHPVIQGLLKWYASGQHFDGKSWAITVESNNHYPHAPWWHMDSVSSCHTDYNGTAQIAGFIARYAEKDSDLFHLGVRIANEAIEIPFRELKEKLHKSIKKLIVANPSKWSGYVCLPSCFISSKESEYYPDNKDIADYECAYMIKTQLADVHGILLGVGRIIPKNRQSAKIGGKDSV